MRRPCRDQKNTDLDGEVWTEEEDKKLTDYIQIHGEGRWKTLPKNAGLNHRCGRSCRLRWNNYLKPDLNRGNFADDEEDLIIKLHALLGNRWSLIAGRLPWRTENEVKNYWNTHISRKLIAMGIDPNNHRLNQTISHRKNYPDKSDDQQLHGASPSINSSSTGTIEEWAPFKPNPDDDGEQISDAAVSNHDDRSCITD